MKKLASIPIPDSLADLLHRSLIFQLRKARERHRMNADVISHNELGACQPYTGIRNEGEPERLASLLRQKFCNLLPEDFSDQTV